jgi:hypothetical protein
MSVKTKLTLLKISTITVFSVAFALGLKYYDSQKKYKKLQQDSLVDKITYANDIKEILSRYDAEVQKNASIKQKLDIKPKEIFVKKNGELVKETIIISQPSKVLDKKIDSFRTIVKRQTIENDELSSEVTKLKEKNSELIRKNIANENIISSTKNLTAVNVVANGIKIVSNNIIETKRFNATDQVKVCFTLLENKAAIKGYKDLYIQIVNPLDKVVSKKGELLESKDKLLRFSAKTNVYYDNEELDVCVFVDPNKEQMTRGDYEINIYSGISLIGSTVFSLK